eukprot:gb/GEZN01007981.1/.p1 GENE.gb/GEZN01007981.1/~~gb/GEZN01007981.1/.p1  ORF type:complete len:334 (+),score=7.99 gb/GEZN01007981.1/:53-1054(+)
MPHFDWSKLRFDWCKDLNTFSDVALAATVCWCAIFLVDFIVLWPVFQSIKAHFKELVDGLRVRLEEAGRGVNADYNQVEQLLNQQADNAAIKAVKALTICGSPLAVNSFLAKVDFSCLILIVLKFSFLYINVQRSDPRTVYKTQGFAATVTGEVFIALIIASVGSIILIMTTCAMIPIFSRIYWPSREYRVLLLLTAVDMLATMIFLIYFFPFLLLSLLHIGVFLALLLGCTCFVSPCVLCLFGCCVPLEYFPNNLFSIVLSIGLLYLSMYVVFSITDGVGKSQICLRSDPVEQIVVWSLGVKAFVEPLLWFCGVMKGTTPERRVAEDIRIGE